MDIDVQVWRIDVWVGGWIHVWVQRSMCGGVEISMGGWMDGQMWVGGVIDMQLGGWVYGYRCVRREDRCVGRHGWVGRESDVWMCGWIYVWVSRARYRWVGGWMDSCMGGQFNVHTDPITLLRFCVATRSESVLASYSTVVQVYNVHADPIPLLQQCHGSRELTPRNWE